MTNLNLVNKICDYFTALYEDNFNYRKLITFVDDRKGHDLRYFMKSLHPIKNFKFEKFETSLTKTINFYLR